MVNYHKSKYTNNKEFNNDNQKRQYFFHCGILLIKETSILRTHHQILAGFFLGGGMYMW